MHILVREAQERDYLAIGNLVRHELGYSNIELTPLYDRLRKMKSDDSHFTFVAIDDNQVLGFIGLLKYITYEIDDEYLRILAMAVSQEHQNKGIGRKLLQRVEQYARENNIAHINLTSNMMRLDAHAFYERNNYIKKSYGFFKTLDK